MAGVQPRGQLHRRSASPCCSARWCSADRTGRRRRSGADAPASSSLTTRRGAARPVPGGLPELGSRAAAERLLAAGGVLVDGARAAEEPPARGRGGARGRAARRGAERARAARSSTLRIAYEDEHLLVVDKPAGLVVHPAPGHPTGTLVHGAARRTRLRAARSPSGPGSSTGSTATPPGCSSSRGREEAYRRLAEARPRARRSSASTWRSSAAARARATGRIEAPIGRDRRDPTPPLARHGRRRGTPSRTSRSSSCCRGTRCCASGSRPGGRTRSASTSPRSASRSPAIRSTGVAGEVGLERQFLHAARLAFPHPFTGERVETESPLPPDLAVALERARLGCAHVRQNDSGRGPSSRPSATSRARRSAANPGVKVTLVDGESFFLNNARPGPGHDLVILYPYPPGMTTELPTGEDGYPVMPRVLIVAPSAVAKIELMAEPPGQREARFGLRAVEEPPPAPEPAAEEPEPSADVRAAASGPGPRRLRLDFRRFCPVSPADQQGGRCRHSAGPARAPPDFAQNQKGAHPCLPSPCASCWRPGSISATRHAAGTRRCAASSSPSAAASTSSTSSRPPSCSRRPTTSPGTSPSAAATCSSSARRSRPRTPSTSRRSASACRTSTTAGSAACSRTGARSPTASSGCTSCAG